MIKVKISPAIHWVGMTGPELLMKGLGNNYVIRPSAGANSLATDHRDIWSFVDGKAL